MARMMQACRAAGTPLPQLRYEPTGLWVSFAFAAGWIGKAGGAPVETREKIIALMARRLAMSLPEIAMAIGKSTSAVERARLVNDGRIRHGGPKKTARWEVLR